MCDLLQTENVTIAPFVNYNAIMTVGNDIVEANTNLQRANHQITSWMKMWRIKLNEEKSVMIFTNKS